ncbi:MAG: DUF421 domain-containing protein [Bacillota bacterium]|uniref:DUF421 domain-containing protein n=1 Tax=Virgibacillus salarius TaxID=447199 RepID=A0A941DYI4_9BACI|nr:MULTISPECIES: DUF421 domain-containing protein [Bacillaceae]MBR7798021.1 DUF421 domain-containing protein [Virgibacillus salarius]MCC2249906.1 DUF421 domain-containing protein [Virgibacillus sp. AGTR]NAZ10730.1 DUF421 domain-containing protein [Agaribacter marinus]QRZ18677.1 DUF421 domain-containing protein [Virgibacillus sp. AGTR]
MEFAWVWKAVLIVLGGTLLLRFAGRKSISQMTLTQTVIMIGIGSLLIQPLAGKNIWVTLGVGAVLVLTLIVMEFVQIKSDFFENVITGKSKLLIHNGVIQEQHLKKLRLTVDQLEMNLRQQNVTSIRDVQWATLEPNGQVGFALKPEAQPVTKKEFQELANELKNALQANAPNQQLYEITKHLQSLNEQMMQTSNEDDLFKEVENHKHDKNASPPRRLD